MKTYTDWAALHTLHPFAWPWVIYMNIRFKYWEWVANKQARPKK